MNQKINSGYEKSVNLYKNIKSHIRKSKNIYLHTGSEYRIILKHIFSTRIIETFQNIYESKY
jgi:hypothetical protein